MAITDEMFESNRREAHDGCRVVAEEKRHHRRQSWVVSEDRQRFGSGRGETARGGPATAYARPSLSTASARLVVSTWLIDKSAIVQLHLATDASEWADRIQDGLVRICTVTRLEVGFSARSAADHRTLFFKPPVASMPVEYLTPKIEDRALAIQFVLAERGQHRGPSIPDLLIAATAELTDLTVLQLDEDFELIAEITGQSVERLNIA